MVLNCFAANSNFQGNIQSSMACIDIVIDIWMSTLKEVVMGFPQRHLASCGERYPGARSPPQDASSTVDTMNLKEIANMLRVGTSDDTSSEESVGLDN